MECLMDHIVLNIEDVEGMTAFYTDVLALPAERLAEYRAGQVPFPSVRLNADSVIDLFPKNMWPAGGAGRRGIGNLNHFCIAMERHEWDALVERLAAHQVKIEEGPVPRWGAHGTGTSVYFRDPEGNTIEARYYEAPGDSGKCLRGS
jgi:catechol 2,3-dioxygenase-like lactoylglutathione lyase family enzyme